ncbi:MAG: hypothetical protein A3D31_02740 [Candidatus Fluviicola riflensis]|nr:MAG: hypothetical protein CHH17_12300 [Candidatus Fluviicola riflensis]OGS78907.1 MAG: hypothetical protein A3D31_02740 [Candidatus Fluviicola riflensis]OGS85929.1 MAG: hypothetical protein A3E30_10225 [Fluviicola sp. RIFCSPHIGHO2_12_FULL_43_24]OGS86338.1 MAG: hypothetical protein A2724_02195 [Fluviicola sp. RIFCSPHIGHO2_01_FULL_43_53]
MTTFLSFGQSKSDYLQNNRFDLASKEFDFPQKDFKILGFGAYHGSAKTEEVEYLLIKSLTKEGTINYYLPETDFSIGHYFNQYLKTGDTLLLNDLVEHYGIRVPQEMSIETYEKWKNLKILNDSLPKANRLTVVGIDQIVSYKYTSKHLLEIIDIQENQEKLLLEIVNMVKTDTTDFSPYYDSYSKKVLKNFVSDYEKNPSKFENYINDQFAFDHIISNLKQSFNESYHREKVIFSNYTHLSTLYEFDKKPQFLRFGFSHLEKDREGNSVSFFTMLIENNVYKKNQILSVIGYLTESHVLWDFIYDDNGNYKSYTTEGGFGIGDYEKEYFRGIENLKENKLSDHTIYRLNNENTPYNDGSPDLIEVIMADEKSNGDLVKGKSTTDFLDYAVLISNSKASTPIQEMK